MKKKTRSVCVQFLNVQVPFTPQTFPKWLLKCILSVITMAPNWFVSQKCIYKETPLREVGIYSYLTESTRSFATCSMMNTQTDTC